MHKPAKDFGGGSDVDFSDCATGGPVARRSGAYRVNSRVADRDLDQVSGISARTPANKPGEIRGVGTGYLIVNMAVTDTEMKTTETRHTLMTQL